MPIPGCEAIGTGDRACLQYLVSYWSAGGRKVCTGSYKAQPSAMLPNTVGPPWPSCLLKQRFHLAFFDSVRNSELGWEIFCGQLTKDWARASGNQHWATKQERRPRGSHLQVLSSVGYRGGWRKGVWVDREETGHWGCLPEVSVSPQLSQGPTCLRGCVLLQLQTSESRLFSCQVGSVLLAFTESLPLLQALCWALKAQGCPGHAWVSDMGAGICHVKRHRQC